MRLFDEEIEEVNKLKNEIIEEIRVSCLPQFKKSFEDFVERRFKEIFKRR